jgi:hypothetical protein
MFMGCLLQNRLVYVPVTEDGRIGHFPRGYSKSVQGDYTSWLQRLKQNKVTHVMSFLPRSLEVSWMRSHPESFQ